MPLTRAKAAAAFDHVLNVVFEVPKDGPLYKALMKSGDTDIRDTISLSEADIDSLTYDKSDTETDVPLSRRDKVLLRIFKHYIIHRSSTGSPIGDDWLSITQEDFDRYRVSPDYVAVSLGATPPKPPTTTVQNPRPTQTPVDTFKRSIKRDPSLFTIFKDGKQFDSWQCSTMALACAQDVSEVLDPLHIPVAQDDKDLFKEKQKYMFAVFDRTLQTDTGKALVHKHENDFDASTSAFS